MVAILSAVDALVAPSDDDSPFKDRSAGWPVNTMPSRISDSCSLNRRPSQSAY